MNSVHVNAHLDHLYKAYIEVQVDHIGQDQGRGCQEPNRQYPQEEGFILRNYRKLQQQAIERRPDASWGKWNVLHGLCLDLTWRRDLRNIQAVQLQMSDV